MTIPGPIRILTTSSWLWRSFWAKFSKTCFNGLYPAPTETSRFLSLEQSRHHHVTVYLCLFNDWQEFMIQIHSWKVPSNREPTIMVQQTTVILLVMVVCCFSFLQDILTNRHFRHQVLIRVQLWKFRTSYLYHLPGFPYIAREQTDVISPNFASMAGIMVRRARKSPSFGARLDIHHDTDIDYHLYVLYGT